MKDLRGCRDGDKDGAGTRDGWDFMRSQGVEFVSHASVCTLVLGSRLTPLLWRIGIRSDGVDSAISNSSRNWETKTSSDDSLVHKPCN